MIFKDLGAIAAYRMHVPRWATQPTSGAGAARHGGRFNRPGVAALYLALEAQTAIEEFRQDSRLPPPGTLVAYDLSVTRVVDFSAGYAEGGPWSQLWEDFNCDWRYLWLNKHIEPPSWVMGDMAIAAGAKGILFPSQAVSGGRNLALFTSQLSTEDRVEVFDPEGALPKNQGSWQGS